MAADGFSSRFLHRVHGSGGDPTPDAQRQARKDGVRFEAGFVQKSRQRFTRVSALADLATSGRKVLGRLRSAIEAADLWIVQEIDLQALLSHEGYAMSPAP